MAGGRHCPSRDRLSELPDNVLEHILISLPLKDAVKTSVLSSEWKERWTFLPHLVFAYPLLNNIVDDYHALLRQGGARAKFHLNKRRTYEDRFRRTACSAWFELVSKRWLLNFKLDLYLSGPLKVPRSIFSCQNLRHLELNWCEFSPPPGFHGFPRLVRLKLEDVEIASDVLGSLLYNCILLESLTLHLQVIDFEVNMPNLKYFEVAGIIVYVRLAAPLLETLNVEIIGYNRSAHPRQGFEIHGSQIILQKFSSGCVVGVVSRMKFPPICFGQVKIVELNCLRFMSGLEEAISLLKKVPNLEQLIVWEKTAFEKQEELNEEEVAFKEVRRWFDKETSRETFLSRLKSVEIATAFWCDSQEFIKCLLERAPTLQRIHVKVFSVNKTIMGLGFVKDKLLSYTRASRTAEVYVSRLD